MAERTLTVFYTSDMHGRFPAGGGRAGFAALMRDIELDGNTLYIDGGDVMQGSPFAFFLAETGLGPGDVAATLMNMAGCSFVTLGNHDFSYGKAELERYLARLGARCLCANVTGVRGVERSALITLQNGMRVGLTGVITTFVPDWEKPENVAGVTFSDPVEAARRELAVLRAAGAERTVCICHMGFENDPVTGETLSASGENRAHEIASSLGFSLVLAGHTHAAFAGGYIRGTFACAPADGAGNYIRAQLGEDGAVSAALIRTGMVPDPAAQAYLEPLERECAAFLERPVGRLSAPVPKREFLDMALHGSELANLFNAVQRRVTGADISCTSLQNVPPGLGESVSAGDVIGAYPFPNTLTVLEVDRKTLKQALEKSASFLCIGPDGKPAVDAGAITPVPQFFNFDYFSGLYATVDLSRPAGERVLSVRYGGEELPEGKTLSLCLNNYRASGAGGYPFYRDRRVLYTGRDEVQSLLLEHFRASDTVALDTEKYTEYHNGKEIL